MIPKAHQFPQLIIEEFCSNVLNMFTVHDKVSFGSKVR